MCPKAGLPSQGAGHNCALEWFIAGRDPQPVTEMDSKVGAVRKANGKRPWPPLPEHYKALRQHFKSRSASDKKCKLK